MRLAPGLEAHAAEEQHGQALAHVRRILRLIAEDDRFQPEKLLIRGPAVEVDTKTRLDAAAAAGAARTDAHSWQRLVAPDEIDGIVVVAEPVDVQRRQVFRVDREANVVQDSVVEEGVGRIRRHRRLRARAAEEREEGDCDDRRKRACSVQQHNCLPRIDLKHELEPEDAAPDRPAVRYRITIGVFKMFPYQVDLQFGEPVQRPVRTNSECSIAGR